jgi:hypothetical protein
MFSSGTGFSDSLRTLAAGDGTILLIGAGELYGLS